MSDQQLRDKIARALHQHATDDGEVHILWGGVEEHEAEVAEWLPYADAVLAVLDLDRREYAVARPASMPDMSGKERYTLVVGATFPTREQAENARERVPSLQDAPALIVSRIAPGSDWEEER